MIQVPLYLLMIDLPMMQWCCSNCCAAFIYQRKKRRSSQDAIPQTV